MSNYEMPLLTKEQEQHLFRKMNYLKHKAGKMLAEMKLPSGLINYAKLRVEALDQIEAHLKEANKIKELLIRCNMRLVTSIAKRHSGQAENFFELLSDGNMSLMRAVEKFDYSRGNKFSTYASWAIMKNFARSIPDEKNRRERFVTGNEEIFDAAEDKRHRRAGGARRRRASDRQGQSPAGVTWSRANARSFACVRASIKARKA